MGKKKSYTKRKQKQSKLINNVIRFCFVVLILYMAGQTLTHDYEAPTIRRENREVQGEQEAFIEEISLISQQMQEKYGVRASISIAQAILESEWGKSDLAALYNNLYGIKSSDPSQSVLLETTEYVNGEAITLQQHFKVYDSIVSSVEDHAKLIAEGTSWDATLYQPVLQAKTYQEAAVALQEAGYATDPNYPKKIIDLVELYELYQYDMPI